MRFAGAFSATSQDGVWCLAYPDGLLRDRALFANYNSYGTAMQYLRHTLVMTPGEVSLNVFTEALLDFELEGMWVAKINKQRFGDTQLRFHFEAVHDADMMKLFGIRGSVAEA